MSVPDAFRSARPAASPGVCGWLALLPPRPTAPALQGATRADLTVIGAGFAGLSAARRLSQLQPGLRIAMLEAGTLGDGPSGRNSGFIIDLPHEVSAEDYGGASLQRARDHIALQRRAVAFATELAAERGLDRDTLDACGRHTLALTAAGARQIAAYAAQLERLGEPFRHLDAAAAAVLTGSTAFRAGLFMPGTLIVQPAAYVRALADSLPPPVRLYEQTPALAIERSGSGWRVRSPQGQVESPRVLLANNGHAERFGFFRGRLLHVFTYASLTEPFDPARLGGERRWAATPAAPMGTTLRRIPGPDGDRLLVRARYTCDPALQVGAGTLARAGALHDRKLARRFPALAGIRMDWRWGGAMALTRNGVPAFGEVAPGILAACGCNGLGASNATASGLAAAELLAGHESELLRIHRSLAPPQAWPPRPLTVIGARATLALREWKAGIE